MWMPARLSIEVMCILMVSIWQGIPTGAEPKLSDNAPEDDRACLSPAILAEVSSGKSIQNFSLRSMRTNIANKLGTAWHYLKRLRSKILPLKITFKLSFSNDDMSEDQHNNVEVDQQKEDQQLNVEVDQQHLKGNNRTGTLSSTALEGKSLPGVEIISESNHSKAGMLNISADDGKQEVDVDEQHLKKINRTDTALEETTLPGVEIQPDFDHHKAVVLTAEDEKQEAEKHEIILRIRRATKKKENKNKDEAAAPDEAGADSTAEDGTGADGKPVKYKRERGEAKLHTWAHFHLISATLIIVWVCWFLIAIGLCRQAASVSKKAALMNEC